MTCVLYVIMAYKIRHLPDNRAEDFNAVSKHY